MIPAVSSSKVWEEVTSCRACMVVVRGLVLALAAWYVDNPARGTPIKFTRSLAAKDMAKANVPINTISLRMLIRENHMSNCKITAQTRKMKNNISQALA